jgi:ketosteroid isomerase-like protein
MMVVACAPAAPPGITEADRAEIRTTTEEALAIANSSRDWAQYAQIHYAPDAIVMPPNEEVVRGRDAIASWFENFPPFEGLQFNQVEFDGAGDIAYVYGTYSMIVTLPDAEEPVPDRGKYIEIWRRQDDGSWKIVLDIFNSDLPLPEG